MPAQNDPLKRVVINLESAHWGETNDWPSPYGGYYYVAGGAATGPLPGSKCQGYRSKMISTSYGSVIVGSRVFNDVVHAQDFIELAFVFRTTRIADPQYFDHTRGTVIDALTAHIGTAIRELTTPVPGSVAAAILAATPVALVGAREAADDDVVLGMVQKTVTLADYPDGSYPLNWRFTNKIPMHGAKSGWSEWDFEIEHSMQVEPCQS
ncbi:hypothetical protein ACQP2T_30475 [Nonomuraea sp. CA-143628]|uniref:hypothetical protein n=1 Tax=Nonomuraea sp. CA-143628 TaxID=3239997 RepID=UPI003D8D1BD5